MLFTSVILQITTSTQDSVAGAITVNPVMAAAVPVIPQVKETLSLLELIMKGGVIMIPILILSILALYIFIERLIIINKAAALDKNFMNNIKDLIHSGNIDGAKALCKNTVSPVAKMVEKGLRRLGKPVREIENAMENVGKMEISRIEKNVGWLGTIAGIAPMFGFLGTIFGVIQIFYNISLEDNIDIGIISEGLYVKMITSASGLLVGILAFVFHHIVVMKLEKTTSKIEARSIEFIDIIQDPA